MWALDGSGNYTCKNSSITTGSPMYLLNYGNSYFYPNLSNFSFSSSTSNLTIYLKKSSSGTAGTYGVSVLVLL